MAELAALRAAANAAYDAGNHAEYESVMEAIRAHTRRAADAFMASEEGRKHMEYLVNKFD